MEPEQRGEAPETALLRFVDEYHWRWRIIVRVMNRRFHKNYSILRLKIMYDRAKGKDK